MYDFLTICNGAYAMSPDQVFDAVCQTLTTIQSNISDNVVTLSHGTVPLKDLPKFDSPLSIAATGIVGKKVGIFIPAEVNLFGDDNGKFTIDKTVQLICDLLADQKSKKDAA